MKIRPLGDALFHADGRTDMKPIAAFRNFANALKCLENVLRPNTDQLRDGWMDILFKVTLQYSLLYSTLRTRDHSEGGSNTCQPETTVLTLTADYILIINLMH